MLFGRKSSVSWQDMSTLYQVVVCAKSLSAQTIGIGLGSRCQFAGTRVAVPGNCHTVIKGAVLRDSTRETRESFAPVCGAVRR